MSAASYIQLQTDIYNLTKRPDMQAETAIAIRKATLKLHNADTWKNDLTNTIYALPANPSTDLVSFRYAIDMTQVAYFPYFRKIKSIYEYNNPLTGREQFYKELEVDRIQDDYLLEDINYWYQAGRQVNLRANKSLTNLNITYYRFPDVTAANYTSWIADQFPDMVIEEACAKLFKTIGKDTEAQAYSNMFEENLAMLRISEI